MVLTGQIGSKYGHLMTQSFLITVVILVGHGMYIFVPDCHRCTYSVIPFILQGVMQSLYYIGMWGTVTYLCDQNIQGTAYGIMTSLNNLGTTIMPYI